MNEDKISISSDLDVVMARMTARKIAKQMGFNTADQARISLATSELARALSWNTDTPGEITISNASQNGHQGFQAVCLIRSEHLSGTQTQNKSVPNRCLDGARQLVDESIIEHTDEQQAQVTLIKWLNRNN
jgi:serine/threonine-protein kinase RsbT